MVLKMWSWTLSISTTWNLLKNAYSQMPPQTTWETPQGLSICIVTILPGESEACWSLKTRSRTWRYKELKKKKKEAKLKANYDWDLGLLTTHLPSESQMSIFAGSGLVELEVTRSPEQLLLASSWSVYLVCICPLGSCCCLPLKTLFLFVSTDEVSLFF